MTPGVQPVLLMVQQLTLGGSERQLAEMAMALDRKRFEPHVGCFRAGGIRAKELEAARVPVVVFPMTSFLSPGALWASVRALRAYVREHRIRVVHGFDPPSCLLLGVARSWLRPAIVLTSQRNHQQVRKPAARLGMRVSHRLADGIVVNCEAMREHMVTDEHLPRLRLHLCYNGLDAARFRRAEPRAGLVPEGALVVGTLCALRAEKNLSLLVKAFAAVAPTNPKLFLLVVGSGPEGPRLQQEAAALGVGARCRFEPTVADVVPWLSLMDIFVLTSRFEALPNALMEAMACGCASVASRVGGTAELITPGETGFLFESDDLPALITHLRTLVADASLRRRLGEAAATRLHTAFSLSASAAQLGAIYDAQIASVR